jgi:hypothetical protein
MHLLGVRHHGPGSARSVLHALDELQPDIVLVEVPSDVEPALQWIGHPDLVPPVSALGYVVASPARAAFAPFAAFSPEWRAIEWANQRGVTVRAIDLPLSVTLADVDEAAGTLVSPTEANGAMLVDAAPPDPIGELAAAAGEPDPERWWEDVIEHRGDGAPAFDAVADAMAAARVGFVPTRREACREAHMRRAIRAALREHHHTVVVVCGAWHVPALDPGASTAAADARMLRGLPKVKVAVAWVPWTHRRLTAASGYGAGVESPGWYQHVFANPGPDGVARFFVDAARLVRERGGAASPDDLIAGTRLAESLAAMRGRPRVGLAEVLDAADAVMGGLDLVRRELVVGDALGSVPAAAPQVPLARDLGRAQKSARLVPRAEPRTLEIDLRSTSGRRKSELLHRLAALGVPWGVPTEGRSSSGTFREAWRVAWEPELSIRLIERAGYGTTVESAATERLVERAQASSSVVELVGILEQALFAGLPDAIEPSVRLLADRAATDPDIGELLDAAVPLAGALRYGTVRGTDAVSLRAVFDGIVVRLLAGVVPACRSLDDAAAAVMVERLTGIQAALAVLDHPARHDALPEVLVRLAGRGAGATGHGLVEGRATRLLHDSGAWSPVEVERRLSRALSWGNPPARGAAFVEGFLAGSGTVLVHDTDLLGVLDRWLASLAPDAFDAVVVLLRRTFGAFQPAERRQIMALLNGFGSERTVGFGHDVDAERSRKALITVRHALGLATEQPCTASAGERG